MSVTNSPSILDDLKRMVILTGRLSDVHEKTLRNAPFVFFDQLSKVEISHDISVDSAGNLPGSSRVIFTLHFTDGYEPDLLDKRVMALKKTVHAILWPEVIVSVFDEKGKTLT